MKYSQDEIINFLEQYEIVIPDELLEKLNSCIQDFLKNEIEIPEPFKEGEQVFAKNFADTPSVFEFHYKNLKFDPSEKEWFYQDDSVSEEFSLHQIKAIKPKHWLIMAEYIKSIITSFDFDDTDDSRLELAELKIELNFYLEKAKGK